MSGDHLSSVLCSQHWLISGGSGGVSYLMFGEVNPAPVTCSYCTAVTKSWSCACVSPGTRGSESGAIRRPTGWKAACTEPPSEALIAEAEHVETVLMGGSSQPHRPWVKTATRHSLCPGAASAGRGQQQCTGQAVPRARLRCLTEVPKIT